MKKWLTMILAFAMLLSLCACAGSEQKPAATDTQTQAQTDTQDPAAAATEPAAAVAQVGFARAKMMPEGVVTIAGGEDPNRLSEGYLDFLTASCIAFKDEAGNTVLLYTIDMQCLTATFIGGAKESISQATGIPVENIMLSCTHDHSSPSHVMDHTGIAAFQGGPFKTALIESGKNAIADLAPAQISIGEVKSEGLVFVRHYNMQDGTVAGPAYGNLVPEEIIGQAYDGDPTIQIVKFDRQAAGKKDIVLFNIGAHATYFSSTATRNLSADFPGPARDYVEANAGVHAAYFMSASGDQTPNTRDPKLVHDMDYKTYGQKLGQYVVDNLGNLTAVDSGAVKLTEDLFVADSNILDSSKAGLAAQMWALFQEQGYDVANAEARKQGFKSIYECRSIIMSGSYGKTKTVNINVLSLGDISFAIFSGEMFGATGRFIRENSPYDMTFVLTCANGYNGYFPTEQGYDFGCYEAYSSYVARGTAEQIGDRFIEMLKEHKGQ